MVLFIILSVLFIIVAYVVFRIIVRNDYLKRKKLSPISYILEILVFAFHANLIYIGLPTKWPNFPMATDNVYWNTFATILLVLGFLILIIAWFGLGTKTSLGLDKNKLKSSGIYKYSRNPQLVGYGLLLIACVLYYPGFGTALWFGLYIIASAFMIQSEEEFLSTKYPDDYKEYCKSVRRIL